MWQYSLYVAIDETCYPDFIRHYDTFEQAVKVGDYLKNSQNIILITYMGEVIYTKKE
jgi:hypothetical protein